MKVVKVIGGLGNQMFQYSFYLALKKKHNNVKLDASSFKTYTLHAYQLENVFNLKHLVHSFNVNSTAIRFLRRILKLDVILEDTFYHPKVLEMKGWNYYSGYWASEKYFIEIEQDVRDSFKFKNELADKNKDISDRIFNSNSVSIHVRRGDYLETEINRKLYGNICTLGYYEQAIKLIKQKVENPYFFIFSNDIAWCKENLKVENAEYIDWNTGADSYIDMQLMSLCKNNILANSTFSWWGAWLNENKDKMVIVPSKFLNDMTPENMDTFVPEKWIRIEA